MPTPVLPPGRWRIGTTARGEWIIRKGDELICHFENPRQMADCLIRTFDDIERLKIRREVPATLSLKVTTILQDMQVRVRKIWPKIKDNQPREAELCVQLALHLLDRIQIEQYTPQGLIEDEGLIEIDSNSPAE